MTKEEAFEVANKYVASKNPTEELLEKTVDKLYDFYKKEGYPNYNKSKYDVNKLCDKIRNVNEAEYYDGQRKLLKKNPTFNGFLFSYFPHWINVKCGTDKTSLAERWEDEKQLKSLLRKTLIWLPKHNEKWSDNRIRQNAKVFCAGQTVSNFNPVSAKYLYNYYGNNGTVLDMSSGWGGRLFGFLGSNCTKYIGYEPSSATYDGLKNLEHDISKYIKANNLGKEIVLYRKGSEEIRVPDESVDFCFTSPPYFDTEQYSDEKTQSYIKFNTRESWSNDFLGETFRRCYKALKNNCYMAINIRNTSKHDWLESACIEQAMIAGFEYEDTIYYEISSSSKSSNKEEPVFIFKKKVRK